MAAAELVAVRLGFVSVSDRWYYRLVCERSHISVKAGLVCEDAVE